MGFNPIVYEKLEIYNAIKNTYLKFRFLPSARLPFVLTQKEAKSQEAPKSCPSDHSAVSARARKATPSEKPSFSLLELQHFVYATGHLENIKHLFTKKPCSYEAQYRLLNIIGTHYVQWSEKLETVRSLEINIYFPYRTSFFNFRGMHING